MKRHLLTLLAATAALLAPAATYVPIGNYDKPTSTTNGTDEVAPPLNFGYENIGSQTLFTADELAGIAPRTTAEGKTTTYIKSISFKSEAYACYDLSAVGALNITVYAENTEATTFPQVNNKYHFLPYSKAIKGTLTYDVNYVDPNGVWDPESYAFADLLATNDGDLVYTIEFSEPIPYEGNSLLFTWFGSSTLGTTDWFGGNYTKAMSSIHSVASFDATDTKGLSGQVDGSSKELPIVKFEIEEKTEQAGPVTTYGDPTTASIGTEELDEDVSSGQQMPVNFDHDYSITQAFYTQNQLSELYGFDANSTKYALITEIKAFTGLNQVCFDGETEVKAYVKIIEDEAFPVKNGKPQWFDYKDGKVATLTINASTEGWSGAFDYEDGKFPITIKFDEPIEYHGGTLLITWESQGIYDYMDSYHSGSYLFKAEQTQAGVISADNKTVTASGDLTGSSNWIPYLEIGYTPVTVSGGESKPFVDITNLSYGLQACNVGGKAANNITVSFDIEDGAAAGPYTVKLGSKVLGTTTESHVTLNYFDLIKDNQSLTLISPEGTFNAATVEVSAAEIAALFPAPEVSSVEATALAGSYEAAYAKSATLDGAACVTVYTPVPAARVTGFSTTGISQVYNRDDAFGELLPKGIDGYDAASDYATTGGKFVIKQKDLIKGITIRHGEAQFEGQSGRLSYAPQLDYTIAYAAAPTLEATATGLSTKSLVAKAATSTYIDFSVESTPMELTAQLPTRMVIQDEDDCFVVYAIEGNTIHYALQYIQPASEIATFAIDPATGIDLDFVDSGKSIVAFPVSDYTNYAVHLRSVDADGNTRATAYRYIESDGNISGIETVEAESAGEAVYYNLQGMPVEGTPAAGIYIRRQGNSAVKVVVK